LELAQHRLGVLIDREQERVPGFERIEASEDFGLTGGRWRSNVSLIEQWRHELLAGDRAGVDARSVPRSGGAANARKASARAT
jgi:hypothetical protein